MTIQAPYDFRQLREANYPEKTFDTGHFGFDVYFQKGRSWKPDHDALDVAMRQSNDALLAVVPHLKSLENEPPESLGRSMLINSYAIPRNGPGMYEISSQKRSMVQTALRIFAAFAKRLETPRMSEQDVCALLTQIPEALYQDYLECFHDLFFASFPAGVSDETCVIVSEFLDQFLALGDFGIFGYSDCSKIIARHTNLMTAIGRDLDSHPFYQEQARVFYRSMRTAAFVLPELGPLHQQIAALSNFGASPIKRSMRYQLGTLFNTAGYKGVWKSVADNCRLKRSEFDPPSFEDWRRVGLPFRAKFITVSAVSEKDAAAKRIEKLKADLAAEEAAEDEAAAKLKTLTGEKVETERTRREAEATPLSTPNEESGDSGSSPSGAAPQDPSTPESETGGGSDSTSQAGGDGDQDPVLVFAAKFEAGETVEAGGYTITHDGYVDEQGPNFQSRGARLTVSQDGSVVANAFPSKRFYPARQMPTSEASIHTFGFSQLYFALGDLQPGGAVTLRIWWKPYVTLIWYGAVIMSFGGLLSLTGRRKRIAKAASKTPSDAVPAT